MLLLLYPPLGKTTLTDSNIQANQVHQYKNISPRPLNLQTTLKHPQPVKISSFNSRSVVRGGRISQLKSWWDLLTKIGPSFGYYPNVEKTWLLVKEEHFELATTMFQSTGVQITTEGQRLLGAPLGTSKFKDEYLNEKVSALTRQIVQLAAIARTHPHAAFSAFTHALLGRLMFLARVSSDLVDHLQPLETEICRSFLASLTGRPAPGEGVRSLLALPPRLGGLGIINPTTAFVNEHKHSKEVCEPLTTLIVDQDHDLSDTCSAIQHRKKVVQAQREKDALDKASILRPALPEFLQRAMEVALDKLKVPHIGCPPCLWKPIVSPWQKDHSETLLVSDMAGHHHTCHQCPCGKPFDTDHALSLLWYWRIFDHAPQRNLGLYSQFA